MKKRMLSALLCLCMVLALLPVSALAANPVYLALGDSITTGYKPDENDPNATVTSPFAKQIADAKGYELRNLAANGETTSSLLEKLEDGRIDVSTASLITITIGGNDMMDALYAYIVAEYNKVYSDKPINLDDVKAALADPMGNLKIVSFAFGVIDDFTTSQQYNQGITAFGTTLGQIIDKIQQANAGATIIVATQYDPYKHLSADATDFYKTYIDTLKAVFSTGVVALNEKIKAVEEDGVEIADAYSAFQSDSRVLTNAAYVPPSAQNPWTPVEFNLDFHPNQDGHDLIADTFEALVPAAAAPAMDVTPKSPTFAEQTEGYASVDPQTFTIANTGDVRLTNIAVTLEGTNASSFTLNTASMATTLDAGTTSSTTFTVAPNTGLSAGTYSAQVKVTADEITDPITISLSFTVNQAALTVGHKVLNGSGEQVGELHATLAEAFAAASNGYTVEMGKDETLAAAIPADVTLRVPSGIALTVANPLTVATGTLDIRAGATLKWGTETFVGSATDANARVQLSAGSVVWANGKLTLTSGSQATIPTGKQLVLMVSNSGFNVPLNAEIETGATLTVKGTLKAVSGNTDSTGSQVTINGTLDVNNGDMTVALKARVTTAAGGVFSITDSGSVYSQVDLTNAITSGECDPIDAPMYEGTEYQQLWIAPQSKMNITVGGVALSGSYTVPVYAKTNPDGNVTLGGSEADYNIKWDGRYLTLRNATIITTTADAIIVEQNKDLELHLIGENFVSGQNYGIQLSGESALIISADSGAKLDLTGGTAAGTASASRVYPAGQKVGIWVGSSKNQLEAVFGSPVSNTYELRLSSYPYISLSFLGLNDLYISPAQVRFNPNETADHVQYTISPCDDSTSLTKVNIDGTAINSGNYTVSTYNAYTKSIRVTFANSYLKTLRPDTYTLTFTLNNGKSVTAKLVIPATYTVTVNVSPNATGECLFDFTYYGATYQVVQGESVHLWASEDLGFHFKEWRDSTGEVLDWDQEHSFTPTGNTTLNLVFEENTYSLTATPSALNFGSRQVGYSPVPSKTFTLTNTGNATVVVFAPESDAYVTSIPEDGLTIAAGESQSVSIRPMTGLPIGNYDTKLVFTAYDPLNTPGGVGPLVMSVRMPTNEPAPVTLAAVDVEFSVTRDSSATRYYYLTFDTNGGEEIATVRVPAKTTVNLTKYVTTRSGCEFAGWFDDQWLTDDITSIYMDGNKTVYAGWDPFWDVDAYDWFYNAVLYTFAEDLMEGTSAHIFNPDANVTRGMLVTILYRLEGEPSVSGSAGFSDVSRNAYYTKAVNWAASEDIVKGFTDGTFRPNDPVTREQMATLFFRYADYCGYDTDARANLSGYRDAVEVSSWALAAVRWANAEGLVQGITTKTLVPQGLATRAQISTILVRFCRDIVE